MLEQRGTCSGEQRWLTGWLSSAEDQQEVTEVMEVAEVSKDTHGARHMLV